MQIRLCWITLLESAERKGGGGGAATPPPTPNTNTPALLFIWYPETIMQCKDDFSLVSFFLRGCLMLILSTLKKREKRKYRQKIV